MDAKTRVTGLHFLLIYVDKLAPCQAFYERHLGFEQTAEFRPGEIYGKLGDIEMWLGEGYRRADGGEKLARATAMVGVDSVGKLFASLNAAGARVVQEAPVEMQPGTFWLQFEDPAGNVIDALGPE